MSEFTKKYTFIFATLLVAIGSQFLIACDGSQPQHTATVIEETEGGIEFLEREFGECDESITSSDAENREFTYVHSRSGTTSQQQIVEDNFPHSYGDDSNRFPFRGSWRKTKDEIMDLVDRQVWSPEKGQRVALLDYFDMVLLINVAERVGDQDGPSSTQRMQVLIRKSTSNDINDWERIRTWRISSGLPCGQKIATPTGVFKFDPYEHPTDPSQSRFSPRYYSRQFENADMYETMFLYHQYQSGRNTGVAIHGTYKTSHLGRRDSGGCVRLHRDNSKCLYETFTGALIDSCLPGAKNTYWGKVPSFLPKGGEADPQFLSSGHLEVDGYRVLIAIFDDKDDVL